MLRALIFIIIVISGFSLAIAKGPFFGIVTYAIIYFVPPNPNINWWASYLPFNARWSLLASFVLIFSVFIHRHRLSDRKLRSVNWLFIFIFLAFVVTMFFSDERQNAIMYLYQVIVSSMPINQPESFQFLYKLITYAITVWFIIKIIKTQKEFRVFLLTIILGAGYLSLMAYSEGKRIHARLENIGTADTLGSNEFALLLGGILPFLIPFLLRGKWYEKVICLAVLPFGLNAFILSNSRGASVAIVIGLIYTTFLIPDKKLRKIILGSIVLLIPVFLYLSDPEFRGRISSLWVNKETEQGDQPLDKMSSGRIVIWKHGLGMVKDYPMGAGPNSFKRMARFYLPPEMLTYRPGREYGVRAAHNAYLQVLVEQGFIGLGLWLGMCFHTLYLLRKSAVRLNYLGQSDSFTGLSVLALNISFVCSLAGGFFGSLIYYEYFWWQIALSVVAHSLVMDLGKMRQIVDNGLGFKSNAERADSLPIMENN